MACITISQETLLTTSETYLVDHNHMTGNKVLTMPNLSVRSSRLNVRLHMKMPVHLTLRPPFCKWVSRTLLYSPRGIETMLPKNNHNNSQGIISVAYCIYFSKVISATFPHCEVPLSRAPRGPCLPMKPERGILGAPPTK